VKAERIEGSALPALQGTQGRTLLKWRRRRDWDLFTFAKDLFIEDTASPQTWGRWLIQDRLAANPENAHTRDDPRISTTCGMPRAMATAVPTLAQGLGVGIK